MPLLVLTISLLRAEKVLSTTLLWSSLGTPEIVEPLILGIVHIHGKAKCEGISDRCFELSKRP
jgi:hypothetical protein